MSDELDKKRQQKIESFAIHFGDLEPMDEPVPAEPEAPAPLPEPEPPAPAVETGRQRIPVGHHPQESSASVDIYSSNTSGEVKIPRTQMWAAKRTDRRRRRMKARRNRRVFRTIWMVMLLFVSIMIAEYLLVGINDMFAVGREEEHTVSITLPKDATIEQITDILYSNKVISSPNFFKLYATLTKSTGGFTQGTFDIKTNKDYQALINYMQSDMNRTDVVTIRFSEGWSVLEYAKALEENKVCSTDDFLKKINTTDFDEDYEFLGGIKNASKRYYRLEGYLFPDTYQFYVGEDVSSVVRKFLANYRRKLYLTKIRFEQNEKKQTIAERTEKMGMTMEDVITMASLIQAEAADQEDMFNVSSVLHNRLATAEDGGVNEFGEGGFLLLQLDSTVFYPYKTQEQVPAAQRKTYNSRYSTYLYPGLPAGPICNPGLMAIQAAVDPADTDYYYFCHKAATADEPAVAYYATTNDEHLYNMEQAGLLESEE